MFEKHMVYTYGWGFPDYVPDVKMFHFKMS